MGIFDFSKQPNINKGLEEFKEAPPHLPESADWKNKQKSLPFAA